MMAFELLERVWKLCVGVCEYAIGRGRVGDSGGSIRIDGDIGEGDGEEDARLLGEVDADDLVREDEEGDEGDEEQAVRRGRLILRQLQHKSYHLHRRLIAATKENKGETLTEAQLRELCGTRWSLFSGNLAGTVEGKWWNDLARVWGLTRVAENDDAG